jgi:hypothetical protein
MKQKLKKFIISFLIFTIIIFPLKNINVSAETDEINFFEIESLNVTKDEYIEMIINLDLIEYDDFNFKLESSESIQDIKTDELLEFLSKNNEEISFNFNKSNSNLNVITLSYKVPEYSNIGDTLTFKATITNNENEEESKSIEYNILIVENNIDNEFKESNESNNNDKFIEQTESSSQKTDTFSSKTTNNILENVVKYKGSDNNYLSDLSITNYALNKEFSKDSLTYFVTIDSDTTTLEVNATKEDSNSTVSINGNTDLKEGINKILITVTAENGNTKNYRIYVTKEN